jgi:hypothetical protein
MFQSWWVSLKTFPNIKRGTLLTSPLYELLPTT